MVTKLTLVRCYVCRLHLDLCFCSALKPQTLATRVVVLMHWGERHCVTNTGHLIPKCLTHSEIRYRGNPNRAPSHLSDLITQPNTFVLYPAPHAKVLNEDFKKELSSPATLIALDGNWGRASHMLRKESILQKLPKVVLPPGPASEYQLRKNQLPGNVCTFEAIARALGQLEDAGVQQNLEIVFRKFVSRSLWMRGKLAKNQIT